MLASSVVNILENADKALKSEIEEDISVNNCKRLFQFHGVFQIYAFSFVVVTHLLFRTIISSYFLFMFFTLQ